MSPMINAPLDTLAQLGTVSENDYKKTPLYKRARAKTFSAPLAVKLAVLGTDLEKSYRNTYYCNQNLVQYGNKITGNYCNNRWCSVCNRIRTAKLIIGYKKPLEELEDKHLVTLTLPNCKAENLRETIDFMQETCKKIQEIFKNRKKRGTRDWQLVGIRKLECTYNYKTDTYHPHYHLLVQGEVAANELVKEWLKKVPSATQQAQDVRRAEPDAEVELFKYFTKIVTKVDKTFKTLVKPLDVIFTAMRGLRVFQPIGLKKDVSEDIEDIITEEIDGIEEKITKHTWFCNDWVDVDTGECLTGYIPSEAMINLIENISSG